MLLGKVVKSNSHTDYVCQIYASGEVLTPPSKDDYAFGSFVKLDLNDQRYLVGLIHDTVLFNPEFGRLGPRLSSQDENEILTPDYLNERAVLVSIAVIGMVIPGVNNIQGVPPLAAINDAMVYCMNEDEVRGFHIGNGVFRMAYVPFVMMQNSPRSLALLSVVLNRLLSLFPMQKSAIKAIQQNLIWKMQVGPFGGEL